MGLLSGLLSLGATSATDLVKARSSVAALQGESKSSFFQAVRGPGEGIVADPYLWAFANDIYKEKPHNVNYSILKYLAKRDPIVASIILTRLRQVVSFAQVRTHDEAEKSLGRGFRVRLRQGAGKKRTKATEDEEDKHNRFLTRCARDDVQVPYERHFSTFLWKFVHDRLRIDQAVFEIQLDRKNEPVQILPLDGSTMRITSPTYQKKTSTSFVQVYQSRPIAFFTDSQIAFCPQNLSADLESNGYGMAEIEIGVKTIMSLLGALEVNSRNFSPGTIPRGMITVDNAEMDESQMAQLEHAWRQQIQGMRGFNHIPILSLPRGGKASFTSLPQSSDMLFAKLVDFYVNVICALYGIDSVEINFPSRGGPGSSGGQLSSANEEAKITQSKDKGLKPLMSWIESCINLELMPLLDPECEFEFGFVGFDSKTDSERADLAGKQVKTFKTVNEIREEMGLDARDDCDIILDGTYLQAKQAAQAMAQQGAEGAPDAEGAPGAEGDPNGAPAGGADGEQPAQGQDWQDWAGEGDQQKWGQGGDAEK